MRRILFCVLLLTALGGTALGECSEADKKALEAFDRGWSDAGTKGDKAALTAIYADDYVGLPGMQGKASAIDATMATFALNKTNPAGNSKTTYDHYHISCTPVSATITHRNTVWTASGHGGKPETQYSRSVHVLEKRNGKWQVVSNAGGGLDDATTLWYLEQDWNNAIWKRDKTWFENTYAHDFSSVSSLTGRAMSRAEDIADTVNDKSVLDLVETTDMNIHVDGDVAKVTGIFRLKGKDEKGAAFDRRIRYIDTWVRRDGRWQAWSSQGTVIAEPAATARN